MNLEKVSVVLRPRNAWEAVDLGFSMTRAHAGAVWGCWAACVLPVHALLWILFWRWPGLVFVLLWWLKPVFDRVPLVALSQLLFGGAPTPLSVLRSMPRGLGPHLLRSLTWSRFSPMRALQLPIWQLEGLSSGELHRRQRVLTRGADSGALALMLVCGLLEICLTMAGTALVMLFAPDDLNMTVEGLVSDLLLGDTPLWYTLSTMISWTLAHSLAEPLFVAGGFGLYINRRTWLEGWDIEVQLRRMARRLGAAAALLLALGLPLGALAQDTGAPPANELTTDIGTLLAEARDHTREQAQAQAGEPPAEDAVSGPLAEVMALPEMPHERTESTWGLKGSETQTDLDLPDLPLGPLSEILAVILKIAIIALVAVGLMVLIRAISRARFGGAADATEDKDAQTRLPALLRDAEPLPEDVVAQARLRWREGRKAEALGLLYRGALRHLVVHRGLAIPDGATESDCLRILRAQLLPDEQTYFASLTLLWQAAAYAHSFPEEATATRLMDQWSRWYQEVP